MGAVQFLSRKTGVGLTAAELLCFKRSQAGSQPHFRAQPVRVALSDDGGLTWRLTGTAAPTGPTPASSTGEQLVAASTRRIWAIVGSGRLLATTDGGGSWRRVALPSPAVALTRRDGRVWALTCRQIENPAAPLACRPQLWRAPTHTGVWTQASLPKLTAQDPNAVELAVATHGALVLNLVSAGRRPTRELVVSGDAGATWHTRPAPRWDGMPCLGSNLTSAGPRTFWLLCIGGAAAGSSTKGLLQSRNAGRTWTTISAAKSLLRLPPSGSLPLAEPGALAAGSSERVWLSLTNGLVESDDGGRSWSQVPAANNPGGWPTVISVLDATHVWILAPGAGLWRTTDGSHWAAIGPLNTT